MNEKEKPDWYKDPVKRKRILITIGLSSLMIIIIGEILIFRLPIKYIILVLIGGRIILFIVRKIFHIR